MAATLQQHSKRPPDFGAWAESFSRRLRFAKVQSSTFSPISAAAQRAFAWGICSVLLLFTLWTGGLYADYLLDSRAVHRDSDCAPPSTVTRSIFSEVTFDASRYGIAFGPRRGELHRYAGPGAFYFRLEIFPIIVVDTTEHCVRNR